MLRFIIQAKTKNSGVELELKKELGLEPTKVLWLRILRPKKGSGLGFKPKTRFRLGLQPQKKFPALGLKPTNAFLKGGLVRFGVLAIPAGIKEQKSKSLKT